MVKVKSFYLQDSAIETELVDWITAQFADTEVGYDISVVSGGPNHLLVILQDKKVQAVSDALLTAAQVQAAAALNAASILALATLNQQFPTPSVDGFMVPDDGNTVIDNNVGSWTIGSGNAILRNHANVQGGTGDKILFFNGGIYVRGLDSNWYLWNDFGLNAQSYTLFGPSQPS